MRIRKRQTIGTRLHGIYFFLWDGVFDCLPEKWWDHRFLDPSIRATLWVLCKVYGHSPEGDQCNIPAHDFCVWCHRAMPYGRQRFGYGGT